MKLTELNLTEIDENEEYQKEALKISKLLEKDCKEFISQINKDQKLYRGSGRGLHQRIGSIEKRTVRKDRIPTDVNADMTEVGNLVSDILRSKANRNNSIFTTGSKKQAEAYGHPYIVFPIGNFDFLWSSETKDFLHIQGEVYTNDELQKKFLSLNKEKFNKIYNDILENLLLYFEQNNSETIFLKILKKWQEYYRDEAIDWLSRNTHSEKTINDLVNYWIKENRDKIKSESDQEYQNLLKNEMSKIESDAEFHTKRHRDIWDIDKENLALDLAKIYQTDDLKSAIESGHEILIHCDEYYLIDQIFYSTFIEDSIKWPN